MNADLEIDRCAAGATRLHTPCGNGKLVWRRWRASTDPTHCASTDEKKHLIVLLHGGFGSWLHWIRNIAFLSQNFDVLAVDLPGLGESDLPDQPITPQSLGATVAEGLDMLDATAQLHLVAFSFGGVVAGQVALALKHRMRSLTLVGSSGMALPREKLLLVRRTSDMTDSARAEANLENLKRLMIADVARIDDLAIAIHHRNDAQARLRSRQMSFGDSLAQALPKLGSSDIQLDGIWGARDVTAAPWVAERRQLLRDCCPSSRFTIIENAGHWVAYEAAEQFNSVLNNYLNGSINA